MGIPYVRHQRVKLTVTCLSAVCWKEIEENLVGMSARREHSCGNKNSREYFIKQKEHLTLSHERFNIFWDSL
jgi:hypothetical protein